MRFNRALLLLPLLAACASSGGEYPSLARRPAELAPPQPTPLPPVPAPSAAVLQRVEQLAGDAARAHGAFLAAAPGVRRTVEAARGQGPGSDGWARAQVAVAGLQATRGPATTALADIDRIYADAGTEGVDAAPIAEIRARVAAQIDEQDQAIDSLIGSLG